MAQKNQFIGFLKEKHGLSDEEIILVLEENIGDGAEAVSEFLGVKINLGRLDALLKRKKEEKARLLIPLSAFRNCRLSGLELVTKLLREEYSLKIKSIAQILNRDIRTIWASYESAKRKHPLKLSGLDYTYNIDPRTFSDRRRSILEHICSLLKTAYSLSYRRIGEIIGRDERTVWTAVSRAGKKEGR